MQKYTVYLRKYRKSKLNPDNQPIVLKDVLSATIITGNKDPFPQRIVFFTIDGKTHLYQKELFSIKVVPA